MSENTEIQISIADIANAVNIIDFASTKGAFSGPDMEFVGRLRNRLHSFVDANTPKTEEKDSASSSVEETIKE